MYIEAKQEMTNVYKQQKRQEAKQAAERRDAILKAITAQVCHRVT